MVLHVSDKLRLTALAVATALALAACGGGSGKDAKGGKGAAAQGGQHAPAPVVGVVTVHPETVSVTTELPGRLESNRTADVRAQVGGIIQKRLFEEGSYVRAGQPLYQLDNSTYAANLESARAQLATAQASQAKAAADVSRYRPLVEADAISKQEYDAAVTAKRSADASVKAANAAIKSAQISLGRSRIVAPISGFIGQSLVSEGTLLNAGDTTKLATIRQTNPMYVNVTQSATEVMKLRQSIADGKLQAVNGGIEVDIKFEDGSTYGQKGRLLFADPTVNENTGQITLRASIPNEGNVLMPGLYVRVLINQAQIPNAFVVPQQSVTRGKQDTVMIVNAQGGMEPRTVTVVQQQGSNWIISDGLKDGDKVVADGATIAGMMMQQGAKKVTPKEWTPPAKAASGSVPAQGQAANKASSAPAAAQAASEKK